MGWTEHVPGARWTRSDGVIVFRYRTPAAFELWCARRPNASSFRSMTDYFLEAGDTLRCWKTAEAAMKAIDKEYPMEKTS